MSNASLILLIGETAIGKSRLARHIASSEGIGLLDLDEMTSHTLGMGVDRAFARLGAQAFREESVGCLAEVLRGGRFNRMVVAIGATTMLHRSSQRLLESSDAMVVRLHASTSPAFARIGASGADHAAHPLISGPHGRRHWGWLARFRRSLYAPASHDIPNDDGRRFEDVAGDVTVWLRRNVPWITESPTRVHFDDVYGGVQEPYYPLASRWITDCLEGELEEPRLVLDLGCGDGRNTLWMLERGAAAVGVDASRVGISKLCSRAAEAGLDAKLETSVQRLESYYPPWRRADVVILSTVLDHLPRSEAYALWERALNAATSGGYVFASVFTVDDPGCAGAGTTSETSSAVRSYFDREELLNMPGAFQVEWYDERIEIDRTHGVPHRHGIARLIARKP